MKFSIDQSVFKNALKHVLSVVDKKTPNPVLANVMLTIDPQELTLTATNMDIAIFEKVPLTHVDKTGSIVAPAHMLSDIVSRMPSRCEITMEIDASAEGKPLSTFTISTDKLNYQLSYLEKSAFPDIRPSEYPWSFQLGSKALRDILNRSRFSMAEEEVRHFLSGVFLFPHNKGDPFELCAIATDGHRMSKVVVSCEGAIPSFPGVILPGKTTEVVCKLLMSQEDALKVDCSVSDSSIFMQIGRVTLISKLVNGQYPDYNLAIPKGDIRIVHVAKDHLVNAADRIAIVADPILRAINAQISMDRLQFAVPGSKAGAGFEEIQVESDIEAIETVFNADYLIEAARHISTDIIELQVINSESAIMMRGKGDDSALFVLMPIVC